jgi:antitoxin VapB
MTRIASFGPPPGDLQDRVRAAAEVDGAVIASSRPEASLGDLFAVLERAYAEQGYPDEWRLHHQGGLTGYRGREVFAIPGEPTRLPSSCALAWNPSISGGGKSEDTVLVSDGAIEVVTRTPQLGETPTAAGIARAAIVEL